MKVQINLSEDLVKRIDELAKSFGVSRSALCGVYLGQAVANQDRALALLDGIKADILSEAKDELK